LDPESGLSRYLDETPSQSPEEVTAFYAGIEWSTKDYEGDGSVRETGWDSHAGALHLGGPEVGRLRQHLTLPVCLNSLLGKYERDFSAILSELGRADEACVWELKAAARKETLDRLMWSEMDGLYFDVRLTDRQQNKVEDLRSYAPLWAGLVEPGSRQAEALCARLPDFMRPGGFANATQASWERLHALNPDYVDRCQWGHKFIVFPISACETVEAGLRAGVPGAVPLLHEAAYRWLYMAQQHMDANGGLQRNSLGGYDGAFMEKMDAQGLTHESAAAEVGYGNQGSGREGQGGGFRWAYDAFVRLLGMVPQDLQIKLSRGAEPDEIFPRLARAKA
jgi:neutral trehalase